MMWLMIEHFQYEFEVFSYSLFWYYYPDLVWMLFDSHSWLHCPWLGFLPWCYVMGMHIVNMMYQRFAPAYSRILLVHVGHYHCSCICNFTCFRWYFDVLMWYFDSFIFVDWYEYESFFSFCFGFCKDCMHINFVNKILIQQENTKLKFGLIERLVI